MRHCFSGCGSRRGPQQGRVGCERMCCEKEAEVELAEPVALAVPVEVHCRILRERLVGRHP